MAKRRSLGRGLEALLSTPSAHSTVATEEDAPQSAPAERAAHGHAQGHGPTQGQAHGPGQPHGQRHPHGQGQDQGYAPGQGQGQGQGQVHAQGGRSEAPGRADDTLRELPIDLLQRGKYQPRIDMREETLTELAESIRAQGIVQPIVVRPLHAGVNGEVRYEIIAGERRWRAAQMAGLDAVPVVIRDIPDEAAVAVALIENIQREDLNPLEEARSLKTLIEDFGMTHGQAAEAVGRSRVTVSNLLRLLELPEAVRTMLEHRELDMGHARALLAVTSPAVALELATKIRKEGWSVRDTEKAIRRLSGRPAERSDGAGGAKDPNVRRLEAELSEKLGAAVTIEHGRGGGRLVIRYHSLDELDGIVAHIR